ncbi:MAG: hypothetical protein V1872_10185 [bacterium]
MINRSIEDKLREEYFKILPDIQRIKEQLEAEVRYKLISVLNTLQPHERFKVISRVKDCESAINSLRLRKRREGSLFDIEHPEMYCLTQLKDLAGIRQAVTECKFLKIRSNKIK